MVESRIAAGSGRNSQVSSAAECIFCAIAAGEAAASVVMETDDVIAFLDLFPMTPGHTLVIPKQHADNLGQLPPDLGGVVFKAAQRIAAAMRHADMAVEGVNLFLADGEVAGQTVVHSHIHVIPRRSGDGFGLRHGPDHGQPLTEAARQTFTAAITAGLEQIGDDGGG
jgi:histidine triad (HIT) family protein